MSLGSAPKIARLDIDAIKARVSVAGAMRAFNTQFSKFIRAGAGLMCHSPFKAERTPSCSVDERKGVWFDFSTNQGGDAIRLVQLVEGLDFPSAARALAERCLGETPEAPSDDAGRERARRLRESRIANDAKLAEEEEAGVAARRARALDIWRAAVPAPGTLVEAYLRHRGIDCDALAEVYGAPVPLTLRFVPRLPYRHSGVSHAGPAMIGAVTTADGAIVGIHRTWLAADGCGKARLPQAKLALGAVWGGFGLLSPIGERWVVGEGYETTLAVMGAMAARGEIVSGVSALSLGNMAGAGVGQGCPHPTRAGVRLPSRRTDGNRPGMVLPDASDQILLLEDADGNDPHFASCLMSRAVGKYERQGFDVRVATPTKGDDFCDMADEGRGET